MTEIQQLRKRLEDVERESAKPYCDIESLKKELVSITQQIYKEVDKASKDTGQN